MLWLIIVGQMSVNYTDGVNYPDSIYVVDIYSVQGKSAINIVNENIKELDFVREARHYKKNSVMLIVEPGRVDTSRIKEVLENAGIEKYRIVH